MITKRSSKESMSLCLVLFFCFFFTLQVFADLPIPIINANLKCGDSEELKTGEEIFFLGANIEIRDSMASIRGTYSSSSIFGFEFVSIPITNVIHAQLMNEKNEVAQGPLILTSFSVISPMQNGFTRLILDLKRKHSSVKADNDFVGYMRVFSSENPSSKYVDQGGMSPDTEDGYSFSGTVKCTLQ